MSEENQQAKESLSITQRIWLFTTRFEGIEKKREANIKTKSGPMKYSYFTIDDVYNAAIPMLDECGLMATDKIETLSDEHGRYQALIVEISCNDKPEDCYRSTVQLPQSNDLRALGSSLTYLRRYTLCTMLNIRVPGEDDDAMTQAIEQQKKEPGGISTRNLEKIDTLINDTGANKPDVLNFIGTNYGVTEFSELSISQAQTLIRMLERKKAA